MTENKHHSTAAVHAPHPSTTVSDTGEKSFQQRNSQGKAVALRQFSAAFTVVAARPVMRYMPTYRLEPKVPLNKEVCEKIMQSVMDKAFDGFVYTPRTSISLSAEISEEIKNRVKSQNFDRYRYICVVTVGEKVLQGFYSLVNFLWDEEKDGYISYVYDTPSFFATATLYYLYYD